ncbi:MAG: SDR family oxidoreductase [Bacteroidetes bacterium]|nr:SDR family oxidoreductase [Bacteroidota bacterium]
MEFKKYHKNDLSGSSFLVTGGAGFIGSNIVEYLVQFGAGKIRILDNLSTGNIENIKPFLTSSNVEFIHGDICSVSDCEHSVNDIDYVLHQAALGSVPRSIKDPISTNASNVTGYLNILTTAKNAGIKRLVYAASSAAYGDSPKLPKIENEIGAPLSPYAVTKVVNELYADVFSRVYEFHTVGLRYFNVFGPRQNPSGAYAAVIPLFINSMINGEQPYINGNGNISRDFTYVANVVQANIRSLFSEKIVKHTVLNIACSEQISLLKLVEEINSLLEVQIEPLYREKRGGDIENSLADISKARYMIDYQPEYSFSDGLANTISYYKSDHQYL